MCEGRSSEREREVGGRRIMSAGPEGGEMMVGGEAERGKEKARRREMEEEYRSEESGRREDARKGEKAERRLPIQHQQLPVCRLRPSRMLCAHAQRHLTDTQILCTSSLPSPPSPVQPGLHGGGGQGRILRAAFSNGEKHPTEGSGAASRATNDVHMTPTCMHVHMYRRFLRWLQCERRRGALQPAEYRAPL